MNNSALLGFINIIEAGQRPSDEAIDEIRRVLTLLQGEGWSGFITADRALEAIIRESRPTPPS
jgi:hypothetical protein